MHILHLTPYYAPSYALGGVVRAVEGMAHALITRGHRITVLTTDALNQAHGRIHTHDEWLNGVQVRRVANVSTTLRGRLNLSTPVGMGRMAQTLLHDVDVLHVHEFRTIENLLVTRHAYEQGIPIVLSPHGTLATHTGQSLLKQTWDSALSPYVAKHIRAIVALTEHEKSDSLRLWQQSGHVPTPDITVIPNGVNLHDFAHLPDAGVYRQKWGLGAERVVLFLGRLHPRKGAHILLRAFLQANMPNTRLILAGPDDGLGETLRQHADERVVMTGYLDGQDRLGALCVADVFVLPAIGEGLSMATLEAMACGIPVIISPECYLPIVAEVGAGVIVEPQVGLLAQALETLMSDDATRANMGAKARELVENYFTWERVGAQLEAVYDGLISPSKF
jgi:glycosyltransferase involved in cell wall biosynthesis